MHEDGYGVFMHDDTGTRILSNEDELPPFISVERTADRIGGISRRQVYRMLDDGTLTSRYLGRRRLVVSQSVREYEARLLAAGADPDPSPIPPPQPPRPGPRPPGGPGGPQRPPNSG